MTAEKQRRIFGAAQAWLRRRHRDHAPCRFDVVSVILNEDGGVKAIRHIPNAFSVAAW